MDRARPAPGKVTSDRLGTQFPVLVLREASISRLYGKVGHLPVTGHSPRLHNWRGRRSLRLSGTAEVGGEPRQRRSLGQSRLMPYQKVRRGKVQS